jgi:hypothetical protein
MTYLYVSAVAFLFGVQLDACVRAQLGSGGSDGDHQAQAESGTRLSDRAQKVVRR